jgi:DMSO/TMAO reductase YedYZ molybdopterin-dependent catalytic subunit
VTRRRKFLAVSSLAAVGGIVMWRSLARAAIASSRRRLIVRSLHPENLETPLDLLDQLTISNDVFFVRSHMGAPRVDAARRLRVEGLVGRTLDLSLSQLQAMPQKTVVAVLQCAGNGRAMHQPRVPGVQWEHGAMGQASWTGVALADLLRTAGVDADGVHVGLEGADVPPAPTVPSFHRSIPIARALDPSTIVALEMNGEPLPHAHGAPFRLVVPGWAGDHWMKWLRTIRVRKDEAPGFYMQTAYRLPRRPVEPGAGVKPEDTLSLTTFPVKSTIARPLPGGRARRGTQEVVGVAFSGLAPIARVEVSLDGGASWHDAELSGEPGIGRWQVFRHRFHAAAGRASAMARATDASGNVQPERAEWNPSGYFWNAWHTVTWEVV